MADKVEIAYRSPSGRVCSYSQYGARVESHEPGSEANAAWNRLKTSGVPCHDDASWMDIAARVEVEEKPVLTIGQLELF